MAVFVAVSVAEEAVAPFDDAALMISVVAFVALVAVVVWTAVVI